MAPHQLPNTPDKMMTISHLHPVCYMQGIGVHLLSMCLLLQGIMKIKGDECTLRFIDAQIGQAEIVATHRCFAKMIYWVNSEVFSGEELTVHRSMYRDDYDLWH